MLVLFFWKPFLDRAPISDHLVFWASEPARGVGLSFRSSGLSGSYSPSGAYDIDPVAWEMNKAYSASGPVVRICVQSTGTCFSKHVGLGGRRLAREGTLKTSVGPWINP